MKRYQIKFAHNFFKLYGQTHATLLDVELVSPGDLSPDMVYMDTLYYADEQVDGQPEGVIHKVSRNYDLPKKGTMILLTFKGNRKIPFSTLRSFRDRDKKEYDERVGNEYDIVIESEQQKLKI